MIQAAKADIIGPAVTAEQPLRPFDQKISVCVDVVEKCIIAFNLFQSGDQSVGPLTGPSAVILIGQPVTTGRFEFLTQFQWGYLQFYTCWGS